MASYRDIEGNLSSSSKAPREPLSQDAKVSLTAVEKYRLLRETRRIVRRERLAGERKSGAPQER